MVTKTSLSAVRTLLYLAHNAQGRILPPRRIAGALGESPTYLAKVARLLVKAGILRAEKGVKGGVQLSRPPAQITLLSVVEACQGTIVGNYCQMGCPVETTCAYHQAAVELQQAITGVLSRWSMAQLVNQPRPTGKLPEGFTCVLLDARRTKPEMKRRWRR